MRPDITGLIDKLNYNRLKAGGVLAGRRLANKPGGKPEATFGIRYANLSSLSAEAEGLNPVS